MEGDGRFVVQVLSGDEHWCDEASGFGSTRDAESWVMDHLDNGDVFRVSRVGDARRVSLTHQRRASFESFSGGDLNG